MIWLTWRQNRQQALAGVIGLGAIAAFLLATGPGMATEFRRLGLGACLSVPGRDCNTLTDLFTNRYTGYSFVIPLFMVVPAIAGMFWGAPLVAREVEQGTHRLVWTQSVSRRRWVWTKIGLVAAATAVLAVAFSLAVTWWSSPLVRAADDRMNPGVFDLRGIVPIAYALFALALGIAAGTVIRKVLPAMAVSLGAYGVVRVLVDLVIRQHYLAPKVAFSDPFRLSPRSGLGDWILHYDMVDRLGHVLPGHGDFVLNYMAARCPGVNQITRGPLAPPKDIEACAQRLGIHARTIYQPGSRFWAFQGIESAIFVALSIGLVALSVWWVRHRVS